jgi:ATP-binding cassette subfamily G (WHITE) protein 2 (PDR)
VRDGFENRVPRTPDDFAAVWKASPERAALLKEVDEYNNTYAIGGEYLQKFKDSRRIQQSKHQRITSPYTLSYVGQVKLCLRRGFWRLKGDPTLTLSQLFGNSVMALIISSVFYNLPQTTSSFYSRSALLFFAVLLNAFGSALEVCISYLIEFRLTLFRFLPCTPNVQSSKSTRDTLCTIHLAKPSLQC